MAGWTVVSIYVLQVLIVCVAETGETSEILLEIEDFRFKTSNQPGKYGPRREKTCLRGSDKASFKPVSLATETS